MIVIESSFNPICKSHLEFAKKCLKDHPNEKIGFLVKDGVNKQHRTNMVKWAIAPYRKYELVESADKAIDFECSDEALVRKGNYSLTVKSVVRYMNENQCYLDEMLDSLCKPRRAAHVRSMCTMACQIADMWNVNKKDTYHAAMLHDICKNLPFETEEAIMKAYYPGFINQNEKIWHQYTAEHFMKHKLQMKNKKVIRAVAHHVLGDYYGEIGMIVFIADKIDPGRGYNIDKELSEVKKSLKGGFEYCKQVQQEYIKGEV